MFKDAIDKIDEIFNTGAVYGAAGSFNSNNYYIYTACKFDIDVNNFFLILDLDEKGRLFRTKEECEEYCRKENNGIKSWRKMF